MKTTVMQFKEKKRKLLRAQGIDTGLRTNYELSRKLKRLYDKGFCAPAMEDASGVTAATIYNIINRKYTKSDRIIFETLYNMTPEMILEKALDESFVSSIPTKRRIQALQRIGWRYEDMDALLSEQGFGKSAAQNWMKIDSRIAAKRHRAMKKVYDQLSNTPGKGSRTASRAALRDWAPPAAWDNIDDVHERPKGSAN